MNAAWINQTFDLVGYAGALVPLKKSGAYYIGACPKCGGHDRFNVKHTHSGDVWVCRHCANDKYHSVIDFFMQYFGIDFKEALRRAGGETGQLKKQDTSKPADHPQTPP